MSTFSSAQSSDIIAVINSIVENKVKIQQLNEDNKEAVKGIVEKFEGMLEKSEINDWVKWIMAPEKQHEEQEKLEESATKFEELMKSRNKYKSIDSRPMDLEDLD